MIEHKNGRKNLTIREIATKLGCSHPNIYNHYQSIDMVLWDVIEYVLLKMIDYVEKKINLINNRDEKFQAFIKNLIEFSINNIGWYKLLWFDEIKGDMPEKTREIIQIPGYKFAEIIFLLYNEIDSPPKAFSIAGIIHCYLHGELSKLITNRNLLTDKFSSINYITDNCCMLMNMFIRETVNQQNRTQL